MGLKEALQSPFSKLILSNKNQKSYPYKKVQIDPIILKKKNAWQLTSYTDKQAFQKNILSKNELLQCVEELFPVHYRQINIFEATKDIEIKVTKKGKLLKSQHNHSPCEISSKEHNRNKNYILSDYAKLPILTDMGLMTKDGKLIHAQMDKFRQINKFLEFIDDTLKNWHKKEISVIDFGCGKSYLTFITYYYLTQIKGFKAHIVGLDLKADVILNCNKIAEKYGYKDLHFEIGNIA